MFKITQDVVTSIDSFPAVQNSDGIQIPNLPGYLMQTSGVASTVLVWNNRVSNGLNTNTTPADILGDVVEDSLFLNATATGATVLNDLPDGISYPGLLPTGNYTCSTETLVGSGTGATVRISAVQSAGNVILTAVIPLDHGTGYGVGQTLLCTATDGTNVLKFRFQPSRATGALVIGYATNDTTESYASRPAVAEIGNGSGGVATIAGDHIAATANGAAFLKLTSIDYSSAGSDYQQGDRITFTCSTGANAFTISLFLTEVSLAGYVTVEMEKGQMLPFQVTKFRNIETSDRGYIVVS